MDDWELRARLEIMDVLSQYTRFGEAGRSDELGRLFGADGVLRIGKNQEFRGSSKVEAFLADTIRLFAAQSNERGRLQHHVSSQFVEVLSPTEAKAHSYFLVMGPNGPDHWGSYRDRLVRRDGQWLFSQREVRVDGRAPVPSV